MSFKINKILSSSISNDLLKPRNSINLNSISNISFNSSSSNDAKNLVNSINLLSKSISNLGIDKNLVNDDISKIIAAGIVFTSLSDLKDKDLSKLNLSNDFIQNLNKIERSGISLNNLFTSLSRLKNENDKKDKDDKISKDDKKNTLKREKVNLPEPGQVLTLTLYEDQLPELEKKLKKDRFSKFFGDAYKSVLSLISPDANINTEGEFAGKYIISYFVGEKGASWEISMKGSINKINLDPNLISLTSDYNKSDDDMKIHHIRIALLKNIKPADTKLDDKKDVVDKTNIEKNLKIDRERGIKILVPSQYIDVFQTSRWGGYTSFTTTKFSKQMVWYDNAYDRPDFYPNNITKPAKKNRDGTSNFDINVHIGQPGGKSVGNWSDDGSHCFENADALNEFFELCKKHTELHGNKFTYTLATKDDYDKAYRDDQIVKEEERKRKEEEAKLRSQQVSQLQSTDQPPKTEISTTTTENNTKHEKPKEKCANNDCWTQYGKESFWNGVSTIGGKTVPKITISKSTTNFTINYVGPVGGFLLKHGTGGSGDTAHQTLNVLTLEINPHLREYNLMPDIDNISLTVSGGNVTVSVPLLKSPDGKPYLMDRRGGWGHYGDTRGLNQYKNKPNYKGPVTKKSGALTEHFIRCQY